MGAVSCAFWVGWLVHCLLVSNRTTEAGGTWGNIIRNREPIRVICFFAVHRDNSSLWFIVFFSEYVRSLL